MRVRRGVLLAATLAAVAAWQIPLSHRQYTDEFIGSAAAAPAREPDGVSFRAFHDRLARYGQWMNDARWGAVWRPNVRKGFWPYRQGHWEITRDYGTVWISDYPWGDIPFHFGRWFYDPKRGWLWVPGYVWGPAWVVWRAGEGKVGWLPMPPWINYDGNGEFPDDWTNGYGYADFDVSPSRFYALWCFVDASDLYAPSVDYYVIGQGYNARFIHGTAGWTRYSLYHGHVFNLSIDPVRFHTEFGLRMHVRKRNDFDRLGPIIGYTAGRRIDAREHGMTGHPPETGKLPFPPPVKAPAAQPAVKGPPPHPAPAVRHPSKPAVGKHAGHAVPAEKTITPAPAAAPKAHVPAVLAPPVHPPLVKKPAPFVHPLVEKKPAPVVHPPAVKKLVAPVPHPAAGHAGSLPAAPSHAPAMHVPPAHAPHASVIHVPAMKTAPKPHVVTHTEVVPYRPSAPPHPATGPQHNSMTLPLKVPHPASPPAKGSGSSQPH